MRPFRDRISGLCPPWLRGGVAEKLLYVIGLCFDALGDAIVAGIKLRFPGLYSDESLPLLGRERKISRGPDESAEVYATRLRRWLDDHAPRGGPYALLAQLNAYYSPDPFPIELVYYSGRRFSMDVDGNVTMDDITWLPDADTAKFARWWLFYDWPDPLVGDDKWGDPGLFGDGGSWGSSLTAEEIYKLRLPARSWNAGHAFGTIVLRNGDFELWGLPEGLWGETGTWGSGTSISLSVE